jgi:hypothetical protein
MQMVTPSLACGSWKHGIKKMPTNTALYIALLREQWSKQTVWSHAQDRERKQCDLLSGEEGVNGRETTPIF